MKKRQESHVLTGEGGNTQPPPPPAIKRQLEFWPVQKIGVPLLALLPVLALLGVFDPKMRNATYQAGPLDVEIGYPARLRYSQDGELRLNLRNTSAQSQPVTVSVNEAFFQKLKERHQYPQPVSALQPDQIYFGEIPPHSAVAIEIAYKAEGYGWQTGEMEIVSGNRKLAALPIQSFIYP